jgi:agmatinase
MKAFARFPDTLPSDSCCILGVPFDAKSSFKRGPALAPDRIRASHASDSSNLWTETGTDLGARHDLFDLGNLDCTDTDETFETVSEQTGRLARAGNRLICLGGDHSITFPIIRGLARTHTDLNILHLDAHPDLYDTLEGDPLSHACPFARIMENALARRLVQAGIRTMNGQQRDQADRFGVEVHEMKNGMDWLDTLSFEGPVYLSIDMDCLDPAFAPGVSHHEPGGLSTRQVVDIIQRFEGNLIGGDIVELNPSRDLISMTAMAAAKLLKEMLGRMLTP